MLPIAPRSRNWPTSTLLANGDVLLGGGGVIASSYSPYYNSRKYIYATNLISGDIPLYEPRMFHTATKLATASEQVLLTGGTTSSADTDDSAEIYESGGFHPTEKLLHSRKDHAATLLSDGSVLITGGSSDKTAEIYK